MLRREAMAVALALAAGGGTQARGACGGSEGLCAREARGDYHGLRERQAGFSVGDSHLVQRGR